MVQAFLLGFASIVIYCRARVREISQRAISQEQQQQQQQQESDQRALRSGIQAALGSWVLEAVNRCLD